MEEKRFNNWTSEQFSSGKIDPDNTLLSSSFDLDNDEEQATVSRDITIAPVLSDR